MPRSASPRREDRSDRAAWLRARSRHRRAASRSSRPPASATRATSATLTTVPAPVRQRSPYCAASRVMLSNGSGEFSGTSRMRKPCSVSADATAVDLGRRDAAQHRDQRQRDQIVAKTHAVISTVPHAAQSRHSPRAAASSAPMSASIPAIANAARYLFDQSSRADQGQARRGNAHPLEPAARRRDLGAEQQARKVIADARRRKLIGQRQRARAEQIVRERRTVCAGCAARRARAPLRRCRASTSRPRMLCSTSNA